MNFDPLSIDPSAVPTNVRIKGRLPRVKYEGTFAQAYLNAPVMPISALLKRVDIEFARFRRRLPPRTNVDGRLRESASQLFDPTPSNRAVKETILTSRKSPAVQVARSPIQKLLHTFGWVDTNIKIRIEDICTMNHFADVVAQEAAEVAQATFASVLKADNYLLARQFTFNESAFLQDRVVDVLFDGYSEVLSAIHQLRAERLNAAALAVGADWRCRSLPELLAIAVESGGALVEVVRDSDVLVAGSAEDLRIQFSVALDRYLSSQAAASDPAFAEFVGRLSAGPARVGWIFDDNGETVFDLYFLERAIAETPANFVLVANSAPVSENVTTRQLLDQLRPAAFPKLAAALGTGQAVLLEESQLLPGLEPIWLRAETRSALVDASYVLLKGASLYESFQVPEIDAYYAFVVVGANSLRLTGCSQHTPVLLHSPRGHVYH